MASTGDGLWSTKRFGRLRSSSLLRREMTSSPQEVSSVVLSPASAPPTGLVYDDPLAQVLRPPQLETPQEQNARLRKEFMAKKRNEEIDKQLKESAARDKKERASQRLILLLGQAEAGKTTILKQMRMLYNPEGHSVERASWKLIVQLNLIVAVRMLLNEYYAHAEADTARQKRKEMTQDDPVGDIIIEESSTPWSSPTQVATKSAVNRVDRDESLLLKLKFGPLLSKEEPLRQILGAFREEEELGNLSSSMSSVLQTSTGWQGNSMHPPPFPSSRSELIKGQIMLRSGWRGQLTSALRQEALDRSSIAESTTSRHSKRSFGSMLPKFSRTNTKSPADRSREDGLSSDMALHRVKEVTLILVQMRSEIDALWRHPYAKRFRLRAENMVYFLSELDRIASYDYQPTDEDILQARVRTVGVTEEVFRIDSATSYRVIDVGGSTSQRLIWDRFFDDAQAIIFLAPVSAFNQSLLEDPKMNRVLDSLETWSQIIENPLLARVTLIFFLNKIDILKQKLKDGTRVDRYFQVYKGWNEYADVLRWFRDQFFNLVRSERAVAPKRQVYMHCTVATSTKQVRAILSSVNDSILRGYLSGTGLT